MISDRAQEDIRRAVDDARMRGLSFDEFVKAAREEWICACFEEAARLEKERR